MKKFRLRMILGWMLAVLVLALLLVGHVYKQNNFVRLARQNRAAVAQMEKLRSEIANIQLDNEKLKDYKRLETIAKNHFGMKFAGDPVFINSGEELRTTPPSEIASKK